MGCSVLVAYTTITLAFLPFPLPISLFLVPRCGKLSPQVQESKWVGYQGSLDYQGSDFTASVTIANPDLLDGSVVSVVQYLQSMTPQ